MIDDKEAKVIKAKEIGKKINSIRSERGISREKLAEQSNISTNYVYEIETGKKVPNVIIFSNICDALGITADIILNPAKDDQLDKFILEINKDYLKLSDKEKNLIKNNIHFLAKENK